MTPDATPAALVVESPGLFTTVQDTGRPGHARFGISAAGAADPLALAIANRLAGNPASAAALEMTLQGGTFRFEAAAVVALAGAGMEARIESSAGALPLPTLCAAAVPAGARLICGAARAGARTVLAVAGGVQVPAWLGSASTHVGSRLGGFEGRALRKGDRVPVLPMRAAASGGGAIDAVDRPAILRRLDADSMVADPIDLDLVDPGVRGAAAIALRATLGAQWDRFDAASRSRFTSDEYVVSGASDRMGLRLDGPALAPPGGGRMPTEGMPLGAVQIPPAGRPVILFVDHQTTGGYPVIAAVIGADLPRVGQLRPGARVRFEVVDLEAARALFLAQEERIAAARVVPA